jgi:site-specific DNA recombinase
VKSASAKAGAAKALRCAIYTRKSSEEGLDQAFNSLHAQREACEAYVLSQVGEGWKALPTLYDDGGFSGGNMDRPALQRLMAEVDAGRVDVVVVYKVDRLTRSLADFAKIVERFDTAGVSFVSVTQAFNTTSSMGRLTLNVLLSFAQFEREVTGERIRDKIAASKKKGMWMGGLPPLGYDRPTDPLTRALVVAPEEAETVRSIFQRYLQLRSVHRLADALEADGIASKAYVTSKGEARGGVPFSRGALFHLLRNRVYLGEIVHKDASYPGAHDAIVDPDIFQRVQASLDANVAAPKHASAGVGASPLKGRLFDADGLPMSPTFSRGASGKRYRYYVSSSLQTGAAEPTDVQAPRRIAAIAMERLLAERLARWTPGAGDLAAAVGSGLLLRVDTLPNSLSLTLDPNRLPRWAADPEGWLAGAAAAAGPDERLWMEEGQVARVRLVLQVSPRLRGGRTFYVDQAGRSLGRRGRRDQALIRALRSAHQRMAALAQSDCQQAVGTCYARNLARLACLAPDIQSAILVGAQPADLTLNRLITAELPLSWREQRAVLGFAARST